MNASHVDEPVRMGVFRKVAHADDAVTHLLEVGFSKHDITVICPSDLEEHFAPLHEVEPAGAEAASAVRSGSTIGALLGGLFAVAAVATAGGGGLIVLGSLLPSMAGGAATGGFVGAMVTRGVEREVADVYDQALDSGCILVAVECKGRDRVACLERAEQAFVASGALAVPLDEG